MARLDTGEAMRAVARSFNVNHSTISRLADRHADSITAG
ncbi:hypothetical protein ACIPUD_27980 [Bradyrhizobium sp. CAR08]